MQNNTPLLNNNSEKKPTSRERQKAHLEYLKSPIENAKDPFGSLAPQGGVDYSPTGLNFERYYGKSAYSKLGFNPYIDNEKRYNENSTFMDDIIDVNVNAMKLAGLGFNSMWSGKSNRQEAEEYERYSNIGSSSKGGVMGTLSNAYLNFGYTAGLLTEIALEEVGLAGIEVLSGGGATPFVAARTASNVGRAGKVFTTTANMAGRVTSVLERVKDLKNITNAKSFYEGAKSVGKAINPLRGTTEYLATAGRQYTRKAGKIEKLDNLANATRGFGTFYRDLRELNLAFDEAQLESGFVSNRVKDDLIDKYVKETGDYPGVNEMAKINKEAKQAADNTLATNSLLIYTTNRIAFGNMFNKYMPKAIRETSANIAGGRVVKNFKTKQLDYIKHGEGILGYKTLINEAKYAATNFKRMPLQTAKFLGKYTRANFGEGMQEYFQEVIQDAEANMAKDRYLNNISGGAWYNALTTDGYMKSYGESLNKYASAEGAEIFAGGFLMGGFAGPFANITQRAQKKLSSTGQYIFDRTGYNQTKEQEQKFKTETEENIAKFNELTDTRKEFIHDYVKHLTKQAKYKADMDKAVDENDQKSFQDSKEKSLASNILFAEKMGGQELILEQIKDMSQLSEEDLKDAFGVDSEAKIENLKDFKSSYEDVIKRAEEVLEFSKDFDEMFPIPEYNIENEIDDYDKGLETLLSHQYMMAARNKIKEETILNQHALVRSMERMESILQNFPKKSPFFNKDKTPPAYELTKIFNGNDLSIETSLLNEEIKALEGFSPKTAQQTKDLNYKKKVYSILKTLVGEDGLIAKFQENAELKKPKKTPTNNLKKAYKKYMQIVGAEYNNPVNDAKINSSFEDFKDFYLLNKDKENLTKTVNFLLNPEVHTELVKRMMAVTKQDSENLKEKVEEQLKSFEKSKQLAELIQMIAKEYNLIIPENELKLLDEENIIPETYQNIDTGFIVRKDTPTYDTITKVINNWLYSTGRIKEEEQREEEVVTEEVKPTTPNLNATIDSPFNEWPEDLQKKANMLMGAHNRTIEGTGAEYYEDVEEFVTIGNAGYDAMKPHFNKVKKQEELKSEEYRIVTKSDLEGTKLAAPVSDIKAKKADIERRRQEELDKEHPFKNKFVKNNPTGDNIDLTEAEYKRVEALINKWIKQGLSAEDIYIKLIDNNIRKKQVDASFVKDWIQDKIDGKTKLKAGESVGNEINAKYDAEIAALTSNTTQQTQNQQKADIADIERRRQELESSREIETLYDLTKPITEDSKEIISKIEEANKLKKEAEIKSKQAAKEIDEEKRIALYSDANSLYEKAQILDKEIKTSRDSVINNTPIKQAINSTKSIGQKLLNKIKLTAKSNEWVSSMPISKEDFTKLEDAVKRLSVKNMGEVTSNSEVIPDILLIEEINAKYDAELEQLVSDKKDTVKIPSTIINTDNAIKIELPSNIENEIFNGEIELIVIQRIGDTVEQAISKELRKQNIIPNNGTIEDLKPGSKITIVKKTADNKNTYIELTFKGKINKTQAGITDLEDATKKLNLTENVITGYKENPIYNNGELLQLHARNLTEKLWIENDKYSLYTFEVSDPTTKKVATSKESIDAWRNSVINKFDISQDLKATLDEMQEEDAMRSIEGKSSLGSELIYSLYQKAEEKFRGELTPEKLELNTEYKVNIPFKVNGKNRNFGSAVVIEKTDLGVTFRSTGKTTKGETKFINAETLPKVIIKKLSTDINAEKYMEEPVITPEEKDLLNESIEDLKNLSAEEMDESIQEFSNVSRTDRKSKILADRKKSCK